MTDLRQETVETYNKSAKQLAEYFRGIGPRKKYIDIAFEAAGSPQNAKVVEIGCGDGRDAKEIVRRTEQYMGLDISGELLKLARKHVPDGKFILADVAEFDFPNQLDIIFAFASLLHLNKEEVERVLARAHKALRAGGVFYISLKHRPEYTEEVKEDQYGRRLFYFYNPELITELAGGGYEVAKAWQEVVGHTPWLEMVLRKK